MDTIVVPCHACGSNNPVADLHCGNPDCNALLGLRLVETTQHLPDFAKESDPELAAKLKLVREAYLVASFLLLSAYRLNALLQATAGDGKV